ncbi:PH domain-containing protein [Paenibacillus sp. ACRSA]|uniref:PH domain-containing protein n=1 Tax=Paenibacillus sp. ACRSA TaxID=2918211 RepID=UPI001EF6AE2D|nr:PH domain-containing protein [Paenibacillus sp. ACRSA]MCG7379295.1 PH domain-containing protein [Paenibacillus sp. ACRSA]
MNERNEINEQRRLHKSYIIFPFFSVLKSLLPFFVLIILKGLNWSAVPWYLYAGGGALVTLPSLLYGWLKWRKFSYTLQEDRIVLRRGMFVREERSIYFSRIHAVQTQQPLIQRMLRIAQLKIETPGGSKEADGVLPALRVDEAKRVERWLYQKRNEAVVKEPAAITPGQPMGTSGAETGIRDEYTGIEREHGIDPDLGSAYESGADSRPNRVDGSESIEAVETEMPVQQEPLLRLSAGRLFVGALTTMNLPLLLVFATGTYSFADDLLPDHFYRRLVEEAGSLPAIWWLGLIPLMFLLAWILSAVLFTIKYAGFTVEREGGNISIVSGLLERKKHVFSPTKVQAVAIREGLLRQPFGYAEVEIYVLTSEKEKKMMLHPLLPMREVNELLASIVPQYELQADIAKPPSRALWFFLRWKLLIAMLVGIAGTIYFGMVGMGLFPLLLPVFGLWGYARYKDEGLNIYGKQLLIRHRQISRLTVLMRRPHVVTVNAIATSRQHAKSLLTVQATLMVNRGGWKATFLDQAHVVAVQNWMHQAAQHAVRSKP